MPKGSLASHLAMKTHQRSEGRDFPLGEGMFVESFWNFVAGEWGGGGGVEAGLGQFGPPPGLTSPQSGGSVARGVVRGAEEEPEGPAHLWCSRRYRAVGSRAVGLSDLQVNMYLNIERVGESCS